jgi:signal transduction histidine kinase
MTRPDPAWLSVCRVHPDEPSTDRQSTRRDQADWRDEWRVQRYADFAQRQQARRSRRARQAEQWQRAAEQWRANRLEHRVGRRPLLVGPVVLAAIQVIGCTLAARSQPLATHLDWLGYLLLVAGPAALLVRRIQPLLGLAVGLAAALVYLAIGYPTGPFFLAALLLLFSSARRAPRGLTQVVCVVAYGLYVALAFGPYTVGGQTLVKPSLAQCVVVGAWLAVALALGEAFRFRSERVAEYARAQAEANRARQEQTRRQASDERLQIARELHDVLGHHLSLINVRAGVGLHLIDSRPEEARAALDAIKTASAEALREVRGVLAALNPDDPRHAEPPLAPTPGLADVESLASDARAAGLPVNVHVTGQPADLPAAVDRAAYRIVQEALTNVRRHAGPDARASVAIDYTDDAIRIRVDNDGATPPGGVPADGNGIPGMRERAAALGGTLTARPRPEGGFRVVATLPLTVRSGLSTGETP